MNKRFLSLICLSLSFCLFYAQTEKRLALVIGNSEYASGKLNNAVNDANKVSAKLQALGFDVMPTCNNTSHKEMGEAINSFTNKASNYDVALFYYAGHGIQSEGNNYLIPVDDDRIEKESDLRYYSEDVNRLLARLEDSGCKLKIIVLDACRNNPLSRSWHRSIASQGLAFINAPNGTLIAYSTSPGEVASDGENAPNSPYTTAFLQTLDTPNLPIFEFFNEVGGLVNRNTSQKQMPWISNSAIDGDFVFNQQSSKNQKEIVFNLSPANAIIRIGNGRYENGSSISLGLGRTYSYVVEAIGYQSQSRQFTIDESTPSSINVILAEEVKSDYSSSDEKEDDMLQAIPQGLTSEQLTNLGTDYYYGQNGRVKSLKTAVQCFLIAAEGGYAYAQCLVGQLYERGEGLLQSDKDAVQWYRKAAEQDYSPAQVELGRCYEHGVYVPLNHEKAVAWYHKADSIGDREGTYHLALCYLKEIGVGKDESEGVRLLRRAAQQGLDSAQLTLAHHYSVGFYYYEKNGTFVRRFDHKEAAKWYAEAAMQGNTEAQTSLGYCYLSGRGVPKHHKEAAKWFKRAAEQGDAAGQMSLGYCYEYGFGVEESIEKACEWYDKSAEQEYYWGKIRLAYLHRRYGCVSAFLSANRESVYHAYNTTTDRDFFDLGNRHYFRDYYLGSPSSPFEHGFNFVHKNDKEAIKWFEKAAELGNGDAAYTIAKFYESGYNYEVAWYWTKEAEKLGRSCGELRKILKQKMRK